MIKEQEREKSRFVQQKLPLLVKMLFEEVSFQASFEGGEGRKRKRIPDVDSREAKGTT